MKKQFKDYGRMTLSLDKKEKESIEKAAGDRGASRFVRAIVLGYLEYQIELKKKGGRGGARSLQAVIRSRLEEK